MTQHLLAGGYDSIAFIGGPAGNFDASERLRGFNDAIAEQHETHQVANSPRRFHRRIRLSHRQEADAPARFRAPYSPPTT